MPDTPPTPTVIAITEQDRELARKWYRCGCGATYETIMESEPAARQRHHHHAADEVERMAAEIAAAREAWGVSREAVAALVTAATTLDEGTDNSQQWDAALVALRAALERVKGVGA